MSHKLDTGKAGLTIHRVTLRFDKYANEKYTSDKHFIWHNKSSKQVTTGVVIIAEESFIDEIYKIDGSQRRKSSTG